MRLEKIVGMYNALSTLGNREGLPFDAAYAVAKNLEALEIPVQVYQKKRRELIVFHAAKNDDGEIIENGDEVKLVNPLAFSEELQKLLDEDIPVEPDQICSIKKESLSGTGITVAEIRALIDLIKD